MSLFALAFLAFTARSAEGKAFLHADVPGGSGWVSDENVEKTLQFEFAGALDQGSGEARLDRLQRALSPMYDTLPKNEHGNLGHEAVRYALHRYFVKQHGWVVTGLDPALDAAESDGATSMMKGRVSSHILGLFEKVLLDDGCALDDLSIFAVTIEHLIHDEAIQRLQAAYNLYELPLTGRIDSEGLDNLMEAYMAVYLLGKDASNMTKREFTSVQQQITDAYPGWKDTTVWLGDVKRSVSYTDRGRMNPFAPDEFDFRQAAHVIEEVGERFGRFQDLECRDLKRSLMEREGQSQLPGRVPLSDFYKKGVDGTMMFTETVDELRAIGALDEADSKRPSVIVPNYLYAQSNCLSTSSFYSVCCMNACEALMGKLEQEVAGPTAPAAQIIAIIASIASDTIDAPRNLSQSLVHRLDAIASRNGETVPIHGRLFAQWMHHAYPYECPFPHVVETGIAQKNYGSASQEEMLWYIENREVSASSASASQDNAEAPEAEALPWSDIDEQLLAPHSAKEASSWLRNGARNLALFAALVSLAVHLVQSSSGALRTLASSNEKSERLCV